MSEARQRRQQRTMYRANKRARLERGECSSAPAVSSALDVEDCFGISGVEGGERQPSGLDAKYHLQQAAAIHRAEGAHIEPSNIGMPEYCCHKCGAYYWYGERCKHLSRAGDPKYVLHWRGGRVSLPVMRDPPPLLDMLLNVHAGPESYDFKDKIRFYNSMFAFTSMGVKVDETINDGGGPYVFRVSGQAYHRIGSLLPCEGTNPAFAQYTYP